jgi:hypothetical protein
MTSAERAKLAALLEACKKEEKRSVLSSLVSEGRKTIEIHGRMKLQYGKASSRCTDGSLTMECLLSGMPLDRSKPTVVTPLAIAEAVHVVRENRRVKVNEVAAMLYVSHGSFSSQYHPQHVAIPPSVRKVGA